MGAPDGGRYRVALDSDADDFGGSGRVGHGIDHFTEPEGVPGAHLACACNHHDIDIARLRRGFVGLCA